MAHTPGPWLFDRNLVYALNKRGTNSFTAYFEGESQPDNARLVHAAPDLLAALKKCAAVCAGEVMSKRRLIDALVSARAAIAEAEGVQK